jgi:hypothetical protein
MFLGLLDPDPDPLVRGDSYYFVTLFDFLSLKNDVNVPSKSNKQKKLCPNPDPFVRGMDPRIRIQPKMSWIRNTGAVRY